ncbi:MAG: ABC transporter ATP-binding protein [Chromatiales bacterium]|nr:MAG: ABC transporter ATP-binding protein [Chromatiales bacterium]
MSPGQRDAPTKPLSCTELDVAVAGRRLVHSLSLTVEPGSFIAMLGPNGVGKTLTLLTLAGLRPASAGRVSLGGTELAALPRSRVARELGMMLQHQSDPFPTTLLETALLGRHAQTGLWHWESPADIEAARTALRAVDLQGLEQRAAVSLSGGERRRLAMATLLTQDPQLLLLDEPLNHLDPQHRFMVLDCLARLCDAGKAVVASLHDPMLASRYASHALLLHGDGRWAYGPADELLTTDRLESLYQTPFACVDHGGQTVLFPVAPQP